MELHCNPTRVGLWLATTARATPRDVIADIGKRITRLQGNYGIRQYSAVTYESRGGLHAHITFLGTRHIAKSLEQSTRFGELLDIRPVTDPDCLTRGYLAKERTPQAGYGREGILGGRIRGSLASGRWGSCAPFSRTGARCHRGGLRRAVAAQQRKAITGTKAVPQAPRYESHFPLLHPYRWVTMNAPVGPLKPFLRPPKSGHCFGRNDLVWDGRNLKLGARVMATIEPDANWPKMWRVRFGGMLSDMANLSRAKDAAISIVLRGLNANNQYASITKIQAS
jgi:hypothetical protein